jgi:hypothetical protein
MAASGPKSYPSTAFILSLIGGIFILLGGLATAAIYALIGGALLAFIPGLGVLLLALAVIAIFFGLIIIVGATMLRSKPESAKTWGLLIIILSILSLIFAGGGFVIGFILALIGGILAMTWRAPPPAQAAWGQPQMSAPSPPGWGGQPPASPPPS